MSVMSRTLDQVRDFVMTCGQSMGISYHYQHVYHPYHFECIINNQRLHHYHQHCLYHHPLHRKGWGLSAKLGKHSAIWGKLGTALQAYTLNPCTKFPPNPTSREVNT